jgi:alkylation response protein AidB-like acyl-CoA dehydrogenase
MTHRERSTRGYAAFVERTKVRTDVYTGGSKANSGAIQHRVAESRAELDSAHRLLAFICDRLDEYMALDEPPIPIEVRAQMRRDAAYLVMLCRTAIGRIFDASGAHGIYNHSVLQAIYRDIKTVSHHAIVGNDLLGEIVGRSILGVDLGPETESA